MARTLNNEKSPAATRPNRAKIESKVMVSSDHQKDNDRINLLSSVEDDAADRHIDAGAYVEPDRNSKQKLTRIIDLRPTGIGEFIKAHPIQKPPVIEGLIRRGETVNIIGPPKFKKSWLVYAQGLSIALGRDWLDTYQTTPGRVC